jgi:endonuclease/exonuclease/phosphatase family metal-dependent hydrolase
MVDESFVFVEFPWASGEPPKDLLCRERTTDPVYIECQMEGASFAPGDLNQPAELVVMAYNVERGAATQTQIEALRADPSIPAPDVILLCEADRECQRTDFRSVARDWGEALSMNYVFGVEFIELPRLISFGSGGPMLRPGEHGNAILSRYPLGNVRLIRHGVNRSWYSWWQRLFLVGQPRKGGRMAMVADVKAGDRYLRVYSVHFESRGGQAYRPAQAAELVEDAQESTAVLIGGDMNCSDYRADLETGSTSDGVTQALLRGGYTDAHNDVPLPDRATSRSGYPIDLIFGKRVAYAGAGIGARDPWDALSDHRPVWARIRLG